MIIAVGSTNPAKVDAVRQAVELVWPACKLLPVAAPSGDSEMPMTDGEGRQGALNRARNALASTGADLAIGMEGAAQDGPDGMMLDNWVAVVDQEGRSSVASGGRLPLPACVADALRSGEELGPLMDRITGTPHSKQLLGASGYLSRGIAPRSLVFRIGVGLALSPFLCPELYGHPQDWRPRKEG